MAEIELRKIGKRYGEGTEALADISFTIGDGEFFVLLGPSGCGKSTLLNIIVGLESASTGEVRVDGKSMEGLDPRDRNMAMVFQSYAIYPHMTVRDNLAFPLKLARIDAKEIDRRVVEAATTLELEELLERMPRHLSGGQRQRVAMGRAIVRNPDAFLLDEPLSNLDAKLRNQMRTEMARLHDKLGTTMVYVTHDQTEAITLGQRLAVLRNGRLQQVGTPRELYNEPVNLFVAGFMGSPAMNLFPGKLYGNRLQLSVGEGSLNLGEIGGHEKERAVIVGVRPEHLHLAEDDEDGLVFTGTVTMVEWLGADAFIHFSLEADDASFSFPSPQQKAKEATIGGVVRLDPAQQLSTGDSLRLRLDDYNLHIFNPQSKRCIHRTRQRREGDEETV